MSSLRRVFTLQWAKNSTGIATGVTKNVYTRGLCIPKTVSLSSFNSYRFLHSSIRSTHQALAKELQSPSGVKYCSEEDTVIVTLADGSVEEFPSLWLRDNCQCSECFNPALHSRTIDWQQFDIDIKPIDVSVNDTSLAVRWSDGHISSFKSSWLACRSFREEAQKHWLDNTFRTPMKPWDASSFHTAFKKFDFEAVLQSDDDLLAWLEALAENGVALIENAPPKFDQVRRIAERVGFIKRTHYGEEFEVKAKPGTSNLAYLATPLQLHTDLPYYQYMSGVNLLHCLVQTIGDGGENQLTDVLHLSNVLRDSFPEEFRVLTTTMVEWNDVGQDEEGRFHSLYRAPAICLDGDGAFMRVNYSQQQRDSHFNVPPAAAAAWYRALAVLTRLMHRPENTVFFKTKPGDVLSFDNVRMVHGRAGYDDVPGNERHLVGVYLDWDFLHSRIRVLRRDRGLLQL